MDNGRAHLESHLSRYSLSPDDVASHVVAELDIAPSDILFAAGSVIDGVANDKSDLDLFLITDRSNIEFTSLNDVTTQVGDCYIDIRVVSTRDVATLIGQFQEWAAKEREVREAFRFTEDDRKFLHRLRSGLALYGHGAFEELREQIAASQLARHKLDWAVHLAWTIQVDLEGLRIEGDYQSMPFAAQELLGHTFDALLAAHGNTCPNRKWRVRHLSHLDSGWNAELPLVEVENQGVNQYINLHRLPDICEPTSYLTHSLRIVGFARTVLPWAERRLLEPGEVGDDLSKIASDSAPSGSPLPHLGLDVAIRFQDGWYQLVRLNSETPPIKISQPVYEAICLFDGKTSELEAALILGTRYRDVDGEQLVSNVRSMVNYAGLQAASISMPPSRITEVLSRAGAGVVS